MKVRRSRLLTLSMKHWLCPWIIDFVNETLTFSENNTLANQNFRHFVPRDYLSAPLPSPSFRTTGCFTKKCALSGKPNFRHFVLGKYLSVRPQTLAARSTHESSCFLNLSYKWASRRLFSVQLPRTGKQETVGRILVVQLFAIRKGTLTFARWHSFRVTDQSFGPRTTKIGM